MFQIRYLFIALSLTFYFTPSLAQKGTVIENKVTLFSLEHEQDTIDFIIVDTALTEVKPIFLWCQGSLPIPLFCEIENYGNYFLGGGVSNFDYNELATKYHVVVISMPKTPVIAKKENLNRSYQYIPDPSSPQHFSTTYIEADYLENYVNRANRVLGFLKKQDWVDHSQLVVAGHSQGTKVATKIATTNPRVTHLGLFSANPFGRIDQYIREARLDAQLGKISWDEADSIMNSQYEFFKHVQHPDSLNAHPHYKAWKTFNETYYDDWLTLDIPIYLAYGTEDRIADMCDLVPLFFIEKGKQNLTLKRHIGLEHNFFEIAENGRPDRKKGHWKDVMNEFEHWIE